MPLIKRCTMAAFRKNGETLYADFKAKGWPKKKARQMAIAANYSTLRRACRCKAKKRMTPTEIVACKAKRPVCQKGCVRAR